MSAPSFIRHLISAFMRFFQGCFFFFCFFSVQSSFIILLKVQAFKNREAFDLPVLVLDFLTQATFLKKLNFAVVRDQVFPWEHRRSNLERLPRLAPGYIFSWKPRNYIEKLNKQRKQVFITLYNYYSTLFLPVNFCPLVTTFLPHGLSLKFFFPHFLTCERYCPVSSQHSQQNV